MLKLSNQDYSVTNWNFIIDKFYEGLVFDFYNRSDISRISGYNGFENYKTKIGEGFSNVFFMNLMKKIFNKAGTVALKEKERNEECDYDFYIRIKNHIFIFEFKDILFPIKETYEDIKNTVDTKLVQTKGIKQLIRHLNRLSENPETYDDFHANNLSIERLFICPIIVYTDTSYSITGINHYISNEFRKLLSDDLKKQFFIINPLAMIHLDFFLENYDTFLMGKIDLLSVMNSCYGLKLLREAVYKRNPASYENFINAHEGFDNLLACKYPFDRGNLKGGTLSDFVINEIKDHLPSTS